MSKMKRESRSRRDQSQDHQSQDRQSQYHQRRIGIAQETWCPYRKTRDCSVISIWRSLQVTPSYVIIVNSILQLLFAIIDNRLDFVSERIVRTSNSDLYTLDWIDNRLYFGSTRFIRNSNSALYTLDSLQQNFLTLCESMPGVYRFHHI